MQTGTSLTRMFNDMFKKDEKGTPHVWTNIEEAEIKKNFEECKEKMIVKLGEFRKIILTKNLTELDAGAIESSFEINTLTKRISQGLKRSTSIRG